MGGGDHRSSPSVTRPRRSYSCLGRACMQARAHVPECSSHMGRCCAARRCCRRATLNQHHCCTASRATLRRQGTHAQEVGGCHGRMARRCNRQPATGRGRDPPTAVPDALRVLNGCWCARRPQLPQCSGGIVQLLPRGATPQQAGATDCSCSGGRHALPQHIQPRRQVFRTVALLPLVPLLAGRVDRHAVVLLLCARPQAQARELQLCAARAGLCCACLPRATLLAAAACGVAAGSAVAAAAAR